MPTTTFSSTNYLDYTVTATIAFALGYRISAGAISAPRPTVQVTQSLDGAIIPWVSSATNTAILGIQID